MAHQAEQWMVQQTLLSIHPTLDTKHRQSKVTPRQAVERYILKYIVCSQLKFYVTIEPCICMIMILLIVWGEVGSLLPRIMFWILIHNVVVMNLHIMDFVFVTSLTHKPLSFDDLSLKWRQSVFIWKCQELAKRDVVQFLNTVEPPQRDAC